MVDKMLVVVDSAKMAWQPYEHPKLPKGTWVKLLRAEDKTGAASFLLKVDKGYRESRHKHVSHSEWIILEGRMVDEQGTECKPGTYSFAPAGVEHGGYSAPGGAVLFVHFYGPAW